MGIGFFDDYSYRGDESIFIVSLNNSHSEKGNINAFVCHENPNSFKKWLQERRKEKKVKPYNNNLISPPHAHKVFLENSSMLSLKIIKTNQ